VTVTGRLAREAASRAAAETANQAVNTGSQGTTGTSGTGSSTSGSTAGATNTGGGGRTPGREGAISPEDAQSMAAQAKVDAAPQIDVQSFTDAGTCQ